MRATKYSYNIHGNIVAIVDSLEEDTLSLNAAIEDVVAEISSKEGLDSRIHCWLYYNDKWKAWDGYNPCTHTFFDVVPAGTKEDVSEVLILPAIRQKAHFLANNPMIMLEKAYHLNVMEESPTTISFFKLVPERVDSLHKAINLLGYSFTNKEITKGQLFTKVSELAQTANELSYITIRLYSAVLPAARDAWKDMDDELNRQVTNN